MIPSPRFSSLARVFSCVAAALLGLLPAQPGLAQERLTIPGTSVNLEPIKGFVPSSRFAGLENPELQASVVIVEMPAIAHPEVAKLFADLDTAKTNFAKQNVAIVALDTIKGRAWGCAPTPTPRRGWRTVGGRAGAWRHLHVRPRRRLLALL